MTLISEFFQAIDSLCIVHPAGIIVQEQDAESALADADEEEAEKALVEANEPSSSNRVFVEVSWRENRLARWRGTDAHAW